MENNNVRFTDSDAQRLQAQGDASRALSDGLVQIIKAANSQPIIQNSGNVTGNQNMNSGANNYGGLNQ